MCALSDINRVVPGFIVDPFLLEAFVVRLQRDLGFKVCDEGVL